MQYIYSMKPIDDLKYWDIVCQQMTELQFPGTEESTSYGTPSYKIKKAFLCRIWEDGKTLVIHTNDRDEWLDNDDDGIFFVTEHYFNYPYVLVRLNLISKKKLRSLLIKSWKEIAPAKLIAEWERR